MKKGKCCETTPPPHNDCGRMARPEEPIISQSPRPAKDHQDHAGQPPPTLCKLRCNLFVARGARRSCFSETYLNSLKSVVFCSKLLLCLITLTVRKLLLTQIRLTLSNSVSLLLDIVKLLPKVHCSRGVQHSQSFTDQNPVFDVAGIWAINFFRN